MGVVLSEIELPTLEQANYYTTLCFVLLCNEML